METVEREYKEDFGIDIEIICGPNRTDSQPIPIALYQINKENEKQKGIIIVGRIKSPWKIQSEISYPKHEKLRWIKEEEVDAFVENAVPDFHNTLHKVFDQWEHFWGGQL